jgi:hypothetical protein
VSFVTKDAQQMWSSPDGLTHRHAMGGGDNLYLRRIAANILNEQLRTAPNLGLHEGLSTKNHDMVCYKGPRIWKKIS